MILCLEPEVESHLFVQLTQLHFYLLVTVHDRFDRFADFRLCDRCFLCATAQGEHTQNHRSDHVPQPCHPPSLQVAEYRPGQPRTQTVGRRGQAP
jgi:hypothetical protein